jgi:hypothetical protein
MPKTSKPRRTPITEPSANDEKLSDHDPRNVFTSDGRKLEDTEFVGSPAPDTDPEPEHPPRPHD